MLKACCTACLAVCVCVCVCVCVWVCLSDFLACLDWLCLALVLRCGMQAFGSVSEVPHQVFFSQPAGICWQPFLSGFTLRFSLTLSSAGDLPASPLRRFAAVFEGTDGQGRAMRPKNGAAMPCQWLRTKPSGDFSSGRFCVQQSDAGANPSCPCRTDDLLSHVFCFLLPEEWLGKTDSI